MEGQNEGGKLSTKETNALVEKAKKGDKEALEDLVQAIQNQIYRLAMRMLWHPEDAEDATQEILVRAITHLSDFQGKSSFSTWIYRIATNYLLNVRKKNSTEEITFEWLAKDLDQGLSDQQQMMENENDHRLFVEEIKIGCSQAMLQCLNREHRMVYTLGEILEINSKEGASILDISPATFRQRLSRARVQIQKFMQKKCGLVRPNNPCRCEKRVDHAIKEGRVNPDKLLFAHHPKNVKQQEAVKHLDEIKELDRVVAVFRSHPDYQVPETFLNSIRLLFTSEKFSMLS